GAARMARLTLADADAGRHGLRGRGARALATDSRRVGAGDAFLAWPGARDDGRRHVSDALAAGAACCLIEASDIDPLQVASERVAAVPGLNASAGRVAAAWYGRPSAELAVIAVRGTHGKESGSSGTAA